MKKVTQLFAGTLVTLSLAGGAAFAATDQSCSINGPTGPDSVNVCKNTSTNEITITCTNKADILSINGQVASSGEATADGNTGVGTVSSGNAGNTNFVVTDANMSCAPVSQTTSSSSSGGGKGGGHTSKPAPVSVKSLPTTGSGSSIAVAAVATGAFAGLAAAARFGASAYRRLS